MLEKEQEIVEIKFRVPLWVRKKWNSFKGANGETGKDLLSAFVLETLGIKKSSSTQSHREPLNPNTSGDKVTFHAPTAQEQQYTQKLLRIMQSPFWTALRHNLDAFYRAAEESQELERLRSGGDISRVEATPQEEADVVRSRLKGSLDEDSRKTEARIKDAARPKPIPVPRGKR